ncbi:MAG: hypothetical protein ACXVUE_10655 [Solirubrobacteraceae bacterium]
MSRLRKDVRDAEVASTVSRGVPPRGVAMVRSRRLIKEVADALGTTRRTCGSITRAIANAFAVASIATTSSRARL